MTRILFTLLAGVITSMIQAQNLVPNPSFESYQNCNFNQGDVDYATGWNKSPVYNQPPSHADYCNSCANGYGVPQNPWGFENAATGNGYIAMTTKVPAWGIYRENIYAQLLSPLSIGTTYSLSFKLSLCDNFVLASDKMGLKFSMFPNISVNNSAHLFASSPVTQQNGWTVISGTFTADSAYTYIGVGNFFDDNNTTEIVACSTCAQYYNIYYLDDISVTALAPPQPSPVSLFGYNGVYCEGSSVLFTDSSSNSPTSWAWAVNPPASANIANPASQNASILFNQPGTYTVSLQASNNAGAGTVYTSTIQIHPMPNLNVTASPALICYGNTTQLLASGASSYTWQPGNISNNPFSANPFSSTVYTVTGMSMFGCAASRTLAVAVFECVGLQEFNPAQHAFQVYPNPALNKEFTVFSSGKGRLIIYDMSGRILQSFELHEPNQHLSVPDLTPGIYQLQLTEDQYSSGLRLLVH